MPFWIFWRSHGAPLAALHGAPRGVLEFLGTPGQDHQDPQDPQDPQDAPRSWESWWSWESWPGTPQAFLSVACEVHSKSASLSRPRAAPRASGARRPPARVPAVPPCLKLTSEVTPIYRPAPARAEGSGGTTDRRTDADRHGQEILKCVRSRPAPHARAKRLVSPRSASSARSRRLCVAPQAHGPACLGGAPASGTRASRLASGGTADRRTDADRHGQERSACGAAPYATPARSASFPHAPCLRVLFVPSCRAAGARPRGPARREGRAGTKLCIPVHDLQLASALCYTRDDSAGTGLFDPGSRNLADCGVRAPYD